MRHPGQNEASDRKVRELIEARNQGEGLAYAAEKSLGDLGDKVPAGDRAAIEKSVNELREALKGEDVARIKTLTEQVQQASYALSQQLYQSGAENAANGGSAGPGTARAAVRATSSKASSGRPRAPGD